MRIPLLTLSSLMPSLMLSGSAMALGRAPALPVVTDPAPAPVVIVVPVPVAPVVSEPVVQVPSLEPTLASGDYERGLDLGQRNGQILLKRLRARTVDSRAGCDALPDLEKAVVQVTRSIKPPANSGSLLVRGFYKGYLTEVRLGLQDVRRHCNQVAYLSGQFAGDFYGSLACQVASIDVAALASDEFTPLYEGWSGGSLEVTSSCEAAATSALVECAGEALDSELIESLVSGSCAD